MEEPKKISFEFKKIKKADKPLNIEKRDYIDCLEEKSIKIIGGDNVEEKQDLVIPMKPNTLLTVADRLKQIAEQVEGSLELDNNEKLTENDLNIPRTVENETLDQMAARELIEESKKDRKTDVPTLVLPVPTQPVLEGEKESSLEDYESVPVNEFGMAMLRGMGWTPGNEKNKYKAPELRPKGLGLGADKVIKQIQNKKNKTTTNEEDKDLVLVKNALVKVIMGKYNGFYGKVVSLDDDTGRVTVDLTVKKETVSINECMVQPVTKKEYEQQSRVLNADKYEEYKMSEKSRKQATYSETIKSSDRQSSSNSRQHYDTVHENKRLEDRSSKSLSNRDKDNGMRRDSSNNEEKHSRRKEKKYSSNESLTSDSETGNRKRESRRRHSSGESFSSDSYKEKRNKKKKSKSSLKSEKRDIDKKRKGKKKKRDRDRSPNYKKYKK